MQLSSTDLHDLQDIERRLGALYVRRWTAIPNPTAECLGQAVDLLRSALALERKAAAAVMERHDRSTALALNALPLDSIADEETEPTATVRFANPPTMAEIRRRQRQRRGEE